MCSCSRCLLTFDEQRQVPAGNPGRAFPLPDIIDYAGRVGSGHRCSRKITARRSVTIPSFPEPTMSRLYEREQSVAIQAVREEPGFAGRWPVEISPEVLAKKDKSPVTVADFGSQALICRTLAEAFPDDPVIAEEDAAELKSPENAAILEQVLEARSCRPIRNRGRRRRHDRCGPGLSLDRSRRRQPVQRAILDAGPDRRHQGVSPRRAICRRTGA